MCVEILNKKNNIEVKTKDTMLKQHKFGTLP